MSESEDSDQAGKADSLVSLRASLPGALTFSVGLVIWFSTAGLLFFLALPLLGLGTFLLLFSAMTAKHSSRSDKALSFLLPALAAIITATLLWPTA